ncbi:SRPBCC family protein [Acanthopleuribacter pedis]|uniref:SRPBCC domain-containing protein n=1 Tax=Acanthopleuribacter pedis TaxID=442870 RepID=A0A8J7QQQ2_9BACT|nr:SRPBCC domain-containing protein [Acanthopleuribacter pedis]
MTQLPTYTLERFFNAPPSLVWRTWTEPELLATWYGPGVETIVHRLDVKPGGLWLNEMRWGENGFFQRMEFTEVDAPNRLVCLMAHADAEWNVVGNPRQADWPRVLLTEVDFVEEGAGTRMTLTWTPHEASEAERSCFAAAVAGLDQGWGAGMDLLEALLKELAAEVST